MGYQAKIFEALPTLCLTSFGFFSVYRFTQPISYINDKNYQDVYLKLDRIINKLEVFEIKQK